MRSDQASFIQAILAQPDDDAPRLIYADWLEEQGDSDRAEFIRLQCELARPEGAGETHSTLKARSQSLLLQHETAWTEPLHEVCFQLQWRRGFVEMIGTSVQEFSLNAPWIFEEYPIRHLKITPCDDLDLLDEKREFLDRIERLDLSGNRLGVSGIERVLHIADWPRLTALRLGGNTLGDASVQALRSWVVTPQIQELDWSSNRLSDYGLRLLLETPQLSNVHWLDLGRNPITDWGTPFLADWTARNQLSYLDLSETSITDASYRWLTAMLSSPKLVMLRLMGTNLSKQIRSELWGFSYRVRT